MRETPPSSRNQISHEPGCTEQNMCKPEDEVWINNFYNRIINQTDPLAHYHKAKYYRRGGKKVSAFLEDNSKKQRKNYTEETISYSLVLFILTILAVALAVIAYWPF